MPRRLLLSGGIGSGKSAAGAVFATLGAVVLSSDDFARRVLHSSATSAWVASRWPDVMVEGEISRQRLGRLVFADPGLLGELEERVHPETKAALREAVAEHGHTDVVIEIPILRDWFPGWPVVVVDAPERLRIERAVARRADMSEEDVRDVIARQPSRSEWLAAADYVIDNGGDREQLHRECLRVWERLASA